MTNEQIAIRQWLSKPAPYFNACGCRGPQGDYPRCPCRMQMVEKVEGEWYEITEHRSLNGITHTAEKVSSVPKTRLQEIKELVENYNNNCYTTVVVWNSNLYARVYATYDKPDYEVLMCKLTEEETTYAVSLGAYIR